MSGKCTGWVLQHGPRDRGLRLVLIAIADAANTAGEHAHPTRDQIADAALYSRATVGRAINRLIEGGWLVVETKGGGRGKATTYRVPMKEPARDEPVSGNENRRVQPAETGASATNTGARPYLESSPTVSLTENLLTSAAPAAAAREEVVALCELLRGRVIANGCKAPTVSASWLDAARLLLDRDGRPLNEAAALVRWATDDPFWRSNIHSMPTFRKQYDKLRLARLRPTPGGDQLDGLRQYREATNGQ